MTLYVLHCSWCDKYEEHHIPMEERNKQKCPSCGKSMVVAIWKSKGDYHEFKESWWENLAPDPVFIESKRHLKEYCEKNGKIATGYM